MSFVYLYSSSMQHGSAIVFVNIYGTNREQKFIFLLFLSVYSSENCEHLMWNHLNKLIAIFCKGNYSQQWCSDSEFVGGTTNGWQWSAERANAVILHFWLKYVFCLEFCHFCLLGAIAAKVSYFVFFLANIQRAYIFPVCK